MRLHTSRRVERRGVVAQEFPQQHGFPHAGLRQEQDVFHPVADRLVNRFLKRRQHPRGGIVSDPAL